jgi:glycosyltransferase involved in cell wall biosynthesis
MNNISIICPIYNEEKFISNCIDSIINQDFTDIEFELIIVDGGSTDRSLEIIKQYSDKFSWIKFLKNPNKTVPFAMNIGINSAKGEVIFRIDAHAFYPNKYFQILLKKLSLYNADNVGSICVTDVLNKNSKSNAIKEVLSHPFGVGNSYFRLGVKSIKEVDTVPFGCFKKQTLIDVGLYNERLSRNQDIELNKRIKSKGGKIILIPDTYCVYYARETFYELAKNNFANGKWNIYTIVITNDFNSISIRHFIPLLFILSLIIPSLSSFIFENLIYVSLISFLLYMFVVMYYSIIIFSKKRTNIFYLFFGFIILHFSYGLGSFKGLVDLVFKKI